MSRIVVPSVVHLLDVVPELQAQLDVDAGGRLVEDEEARAVHEGAGQDQPALHPARERPRALVLLLGQRERLQELLRAVAPLALARHPEVAAVEVERLLDGQEEVDVQLLRRKPDRGAGVRVVVERVVAEDP